MQEQMYQKKLKNATWDFSNCYRGVILKQTHIHRFWPPKSTKRKQNFKNLQMKCHESWIPEQKFYIIFLWIRFTWPLLHVLDTGTQRSTDTKLKPSYPGVTPVTQFKMLWGWPIRKRISETRSWRFLWLFFLWQVNQKGIWFFCFSSNNS